MASGARSKSLGIVCHVLKSNTSRPRSGALLGKRVYARPAAAADDAAAADATDAADATAADRSGLSNHAS